MKEGDDWQSKLNSLHQKLQNEREMNKALQAQLDRKVEAEV